MTTKPSTSTRRSVHQRPAWRLRLCGAWLLCAIALGAGAQPWGLQLRDAPGNQAAEVVAVTPGSPAAAAGIRPGDWVRQAQQFLVRNAEDFHNIARLSEGRASLLLRVSRDGWEKDLSLAAGGMAAVAPAAAPPPPPAPPKAWVGLQVSDAIGEAGGAQAGAAVTGLAAGGPGDRAGLKVGDLITQIDGRPLANAAELAAAIGDWPIGRPMRLAVQREGWGREVTLVPGVLSPGGTTAAPSALQRATPATPPPALPPARAEPAPPPPARLAPEVRAPGDAVPAARVAAAPAPGHKALVAIGDFQVKAAGASPAIGDGLREMLVTALHGSGSFVVVERMDLQGLAAEQALSRSRMARPGSAVPEQRMDVADIMVYGAVTEFEGEAKGSSSQFGLPRLSFGRDAKTARMAIDVRVVDVASGRILGAQRIAGDAQSSSTRVGAEPTVHGVGIPVGLGMFQNTPMEAAIRSCVEKAVAYVGTTVPPAYFSRQ